MLANLASPSGLHTEIASNLQSRTATQVDIYRYDNTVKVNGISWGKLSVLVS